MSAAELLAEVQERDEDNQGLLVLLDNDDDMGRLVAVWQNMMLPAFNGDEAAPDTLRGLQRLRRLWSQIDYDFVAEWIGLAGLPDAAHIRRSAQLAMDNRAVYPDGSLSYWAQVWVYGTARIAPEPVP